MSRITYCNPKLYIDGKLIESLIDFSFSEAMNNSLQSFRAKCSEPDLENRDLFNKKVEFYLNYGSEDGVPLFRGYIREFSATDTSFSFSAQDPRVFLTGNNAMPVSITDKNNFDGYTLTQFLHKYITDNININSTKIGLNSLSEIDKPVFMTGERHDSSEPWGLVTTILGRAINDDNVENPLSYFTDILHGSSTSDIIFRKKSSLDNKPVTIFKYNDGIIRINYKERAPASVGLAKTKDGITSEFIYGNTPKGRVGKQITGDFETPAEAQRAARNAILLEYENTKELTITVSKGIYIKLGDIIKVDVPDYNIEGKVRVTGKNISGSKNSFSCSLQCNTEPLKLSDFI
tara:strand:+ start:1161 stop:2201 length:1041 start_codon:yes stop_codon:yes gene_type:complete